MKSYEKIKKVSECLYSDLENGKDVKVRLQNEARKIHTQISEDFKSLFGRELILRDFYVFVDDETYRQNATGLILNGTILNCEEFKIKVECLIDHGRIWIKVKEGKEISDFVDITNRIERVQNSEGLTELMEIK